LQQPEPHLSGCDVEDIFVLGLALAPAARQRMQQALPHCVLYTPTAESRGMTSDLCEKLGKVVVINYMPSLLPHMLLRTSAVFNKALVKVLGMHPVCDSSVCDSALECEFDGVVSDDISPEMLRKAIATVQRGELWYPRLYLSNKLRKALAKSAPGSLSDRETQILDLMAQGETNQVIADKLCLTRGTVRWHLRSIYTKLGVSNRNAALRLAKNQSSAAIGNG
jgi:DNA-binding NarL/FixJ family response regulator